MAAVVASIVPQMLVGRRYGIDVIYGLLKIYDRVPTREDTQIFLRFVTVTVHGVRNLENLARIFCTRCSLRRLRTATVSYYHKDEEE